MYLRTQTFEQKLLCGMRMQMSFADLRTHLLWSRFMPRRKEILNSLGTDRYSVEVYPPSFFDPYDPHRAFDKWAAVEVADEGSIPEGMETLVIPAGLYAVFLHRGPASEASTTYNYIFLSWLAASGYRLDDRPHFAVMGEKYIKDSLHSEEEIWIPIA